MKRLAAAAAIVAWAAAIGGLGSAASSRTAPRCHGRAPTIVGTEGDDLILGTPRNDVILALEGADAVHAGFGHDTVCGGPGDDDVRGGLGFDALYGDEGNDAVRGGADADSSSGGEGADRLAGGDGDDRLTGGRGLDEVEGGGGTDRASASDLEAPVRIDLAMGVVAALGDSDVLVGIEGAEGSPLDDAIDGDGGPNALLGGAGADTIAGGDGADVLEGGADDDSLDGGGGRDTASFERAVTAIDASLEDGSATGDGGDSLVSIENLTGGFYGDRLRGSSGANALSGGWGEDRLEGGGGDDRFVPGLSDDAVSGGPGRDWMLYAKASGPVDATMRRAEVVGEGVDTYEGVEVISGSNWSGDVIRGDSRANWLFGGAGADRIYGRRGRDYLVGGPMRDLVVGGPGRDSCEDLMVNRLVGCEDRTHGDGSAESVVTHPRHGSTFRARAPDSLRGYVAGPRAPVEVALVRVTENGCFAWTGTRWEGAACDARRWHRAEGRRWWSYGAPRRLPDARYVVHARIRGSAEPSEAGRNEIHFRVLRR
ncbi:MAG: calcium-binding protein [Actinomycetota bacterium]